MLLLVGLGLGEIGGLGEGLIFLGLVLLFVFIFLVELIFFFFLVKVIVILKGFNKFVFGFGCRFLLISWVVYIKFEVFIRVVV